MRWLLRPWHDKSEFESPSPLLNGDDALLEELWNKQYSLKEFTDPSNFKSYEELQKRMDIVLSGTTKVGNVQEKIKEESVESVESTTPQDIVPPKEDDTMTYFEKLANS